MSDQLPVFLVTVSREAGLWVAVVDGLPGGATDVERFEDLPGAVHDLIATLKGIETGNFWVEWHYRQGDYELTEALLVLRQWEQQAEIAVAQRNFARRLAVESMRQAGLSYREIGEVIGTSHQRVGQLLGSRSGHDVDLVADSILLKARRWLKGGYLRSGVAGKHSQVHGDLHPSSIVTPIEAATAVLIDLVLQASPLDRRDLLTGTAEALEAVAENDDFLAQGV